MGCATSTEQPVALPGPSHRTGGALTPPRRARSPAAAAATNNDADPFNSPTSSRFSGLPWRPASPRAAARAATPRSPVATPAQAPPRAAVGTPEAAATPAGITRADSQETQRSTDSVAPPTVASTGLPPSVREHTPQPQLLLTPRTSAPPTDGERTPGATSFLQEHVMMLPAPRTPTAPPSRNHSRQRSPIEAGPPIPPTPVSVPDGAITTVATTGGGDGEHSDGRASPDVMRPFLPLTGTSDHADHAHEPPSASVRPARPSDESELATVSTSPASFNPNPLAALPPLPPDAHPRAGTDEQHARHPMRSAPDTPAALHAYTRHHSPRSNVSGRATASMPTGGSRSSFTLNMSSRRASGTRGGSMGFSMSGSQSPRAALDGTEPGTPFGALPDNTLPPAASPNDNDLRPQP
uniref:Uncharacterized protein n=1 Tax=Neobodo designis TaxID=312471 RepID=A0A7S1QV76_NEODS|mmetsp:Transcript_5261/g.16699  ORF Transcript_5261/g.16699 Transcript_5261/m.16699 type:complete len:410 (+) Transcript_5261:179-1408(+)